MFSALVHEQQRLLDYGLRKDKATIHSSQAPQHRRSSDERLDVDRAKGCIAVPKEDAGLALIWQQRFGKLLRCAAVAPALTTVERCALVAGIDLPSRRLQPCQRLG